MIRHQRRPPRRSNTTTEEVPPDPTLSEETKRPERNSSFTRCLLDDIDASKLTAQIEGHPTARGTALLLQALRQQVSMCASVEYSARSLEWIVENDILQLKHRKSSLLYRVLQSDVVDSREQMARLANTIASFSRGRSYFAAHQKSLLPCLVALVRGRRLPTTTFDQLVATLQKLSVRPSCQRELLQSGMLEWVVTLLEHRCSPYAFEYASALATNISLNPTASSTVLRFADSIASAAVCVLSRDTHGQCCSLFNGLVFTWLSCGKVRVRARETKLADSIRARLGRKNCSLCALHVPYLLALIAGEAEVLRVPQAPHEHDTDTAGDSCERDVDSTDPLRPSSNELSGARLLLRRANKEYHPNEVPRRSPPRNRNEGRLGTATSCHTFIVDVERRRPLVLPVGLTDGALEYKKIMDAKQAEAKKAEKERQEKEERAMRLGKKPHNGSRKELVSKERDFGSKEKDLGSNSKEKDLGSTERIDRPVRRPAKLATRTSPPLKNSQPPTPNPSAETEQENFTPDEYAAVFAARPKVARTPDQNRSFF